MSAAARRAQVTVVVVSWNTRDLLDACLRSLRADHDAGRADVVVVDNGSSDGSPALVREAHPWVRLLERPDNPGFGAAVNHGADGSATPFVVAANADVALAPDALQRLLAAAADHPRAGILAPRLVTPGGPVQHSVHPFPSLRAVLAADAGLGALLPPLARRLPLEGAWDHQQDRDVDWAHGALLLVRRACWEALGGFDPAMWLYAEDLDLCWRARRAGWSTRYVAGAHVVHHVSAATGQAWGEARHERAHRAAAAWSRARLGARRTVARDTVALATLGAREAALAAAARIAPERYAWRRDRLRQYRRMQRTTLLGDPDGSR